MGEWAHRLGRWCLCRRLHSLCRIVITKRIVVAGRVASGVFVTRVITKRIVVASRVASGVFVTLLTAPTIAKFAEHNISRFTTVDCVNWLME